MPPVALFVFDRFELLPRTLECLRRTGVERLYVYSDGPRGPQDVEAVDRVRDLVGGISWAAVAVVARSTNLGLSASIRSGVDAVLERHDRVAVVEDDVCVAPEFLEYVSAALDHYADDGTVAGVCGLRYPFDPAALDAHPYDGFLFPRFFSWGWATWRRAWEAFEFDRARLEAAWRAAGVDPAVGGRDLGPMIEAAVEGRLTGAWDVLCAANLLVRGETFLVPSWNMVENTGLARGTHFAKPPPWQLRWETERRPSTGPLRFPAAVDAEVAGALRSFFEPSPAVTRGRRIVRGLRRRLRRA